MKPLDSLYALALHAYPRPFRRRFGQEMQQTFHARAAAARNRPAFLFATAKDLIVTSTQERIACMSISKLAYALGALALFLLGSTTVVQAYVIPTPSMDPTLRPGDHIIVNKTAHTFARGEMMVFRYPADPTQSFIKRVVGLPGDHLRIENKQLIRNGQPVAEAWAHHSASSNPQQDNLAETTVPANSYFVLGDNRDFSIDSRTFGLVPEANIIGRPWFVYWSWDDAQGKTRWDRTLLVP